MDAELQQLALRCCAACAASKLTRRADSDDVRSGFAPSFAPGPAVRQEPAPAQPDGGATAVSGSKSGGRLRRARGASAGAAAATAAAAQAGPDTASSACGAPTPPSAETAAGDVGAAASSELGREPAGEPGCAAALQRGCAAPAE